MRAALAAVDAGALVRDALRDHDLLQALRDAQGVDVIAAGKAAVPMLEAYVRAGVTPARRSLAIGPATGPTDATAERENSGRPPLPASTEWFAAGHPQPTGASVAAARRALEMASAARAGDLLVVLLSGGGSALMALPAPGVTLSDKQQTSRLLMERSADIHELNTVRKHLSAIKGGQLAAATAGAVRTLALSDVVGDDLSVIASGPTVPDTTTFAGALAVLERRGGRLHYPSAVVARLSAGAAGALPETPKPGDRRLERAQARVIGPQRGAIDGARRAAEALGYAVVVIDEPVTGEARIAGRRLVDRVSPLLGDLSRSTCVIASGETTVSVAGSGRGGRNQEVACAMADVLHHLGTAVAASVGTDGIDGPTDAAGAIVDTSTRARAEAAGIGPPDTYLADNNTYAFFDALGDLVRTGPTGTNVGDLQVMLVARPSPGR